MDAPPPPSSAPARHVLFTAGLLLAVSLAAAPTVILAPNDVHVIAADGSAGKSADPAKQAFLERCAKDFAGPATFDLELAVVTPGSWGRVVSPESGGRLQFHQHFPHGFVCHLELHHLLPRHAYVLTLNGHVDHAGNELLPDLVPGKPLEHYVDFLTITTDADGGYEGSLGVYLAPGSYDVRFYVKDPDDYRIVLHRDFFRFTVD